MTVKEWQKEIALLPEKERKAYLNALKELQRWAKFDAEYSRTGLNTLQYLLGEVIRTGRSVSHATGSTSKGICVNDRRKPVNCFDCPHVKRDDRPFVDRRFYCGLKPKEKRRFTTIYDCVRIPDECPEWGV